MFVEFTSIGFSTGNMEVSTQPILDILGLFNFRIRNYTDYTIFNSDTFFIDPFFVSKVYARQNVPEEVQLYIILNSTYIHNNTVFGPLIFRPHLQAISGAVILPSQNSWVAGVISRGFVSAGFLLTKNLELFTLIESGVLVNVWTSQEKPEDWETVLNEARQKSLYVTARVGGIWYYDRYSGIGLGYRFIIHGADSPLRFVQGYSLNDLLYNYFNALYYTSPEQQISIPFITTDYYLSFSTRF
ncbi:hypothetical protein [Fervidobacterium islandicum]|uniref:hypothetical protein n=1 Tax=Fervidobacterium islandicum TaxID=2423 RepID=UPI003A62689D